MLMSLRVLRWSRQAKTECTWSIYPIERHRKPSHCWVAETFAMALRADVRNAGKCRKAGDRWLDEGKALLLRAPSAVVPQEMNFMFNPPHPRMGEVKIVHREAFLFDNRLLFQ